MPKSNIGEEPVYLAPTSRSQSIIEISQDRNSRRKGNRNQRMPLARLPFLIQPRPIMHSGLCLQESLTYMTTGQPDGDNSSTEVTTGYVKFAIKKLTRIMTETEEGDSDYQNFDGFGLNWPSTPKLGV